MLCLRFVILFLQDAEVVLHFQLYLVALKRID